LDEQNNRKQNLNGKQNEFEQQSRMLEIAVEAARQGARRLS
jgi:hypothetical protein